ncbi:MAG: beta-ketoacyl-[acyl-carrier-protein] synthase family protein [Phycisphaerae bacterium]|nr:beta-ketoacyl-[acyl-carrier-protein] synthase family protein [Phycisphaerae bacterium]
MNRVGITGMGVVSPVGTGREAFWSSLVNGRSGIKPITLFDASSFPVRIGGEVRNIGWKAIAEEFIQAENVQDRKVLLGLAAAQEAIADSGLSDLALGAALLHVGVGLEAIRLEDLALCVSGNADAANTSFLGNLNGRQFQTPLDTMCNLLGDRYGFSAGRYTNGSACAAGAQAIGEAWQMLREGYADAALAGATDSMLNPLGLGGFSLLRVLSDENETPHRACRPFDASRKGTVLGEGAAFVMLEVLERAWERGVRVYAEVIGYGSSLDAFSVSDPDDAGRGAVASMRQAIRSARLRHEDVDCVNAHGTGTVKNDVIETAAIKETLGPYAHHIPVHSVKSMTGHMIAASGAVEAVAAALTIQRRRVPPTINLVKADDLCDLDYVTDGARDFSGDVVLSNSFGFGGQNATLIFRRSG